MQIAYLRGTNQTAALHRPTPLRVHRIFDRSIRPTPNKNGLSLNSLGIPQVRERSASSISICGTSNTTYKPPETRARASDPDTSREAAKRANQYASRIDAAIIGYPTRHPHGGTSRDISAETGLDLVSVSPRLKPLEKAGRVRRAGRRVNPTSGCGATNWRLADTGSESQIEGDL
jgi:hypothetical protein